MANLLECQYCKAILKTKARLKKHILQVHKSPYRFVSIHNSFKGISNIYEKPNYNGFVKVFNCGVETNRKKH